MNIAFAEGQGLPTLVGEQKKSLDKLKHNLLGIVRGNRVIFEESDDEVNYINGGYIVKSENTISIIKDCGLYYENLFDERSLV